MRKQLLDISGSLRQHIIQIRAWLMTIQPRRRRDLGTLERIRYRETATSPSAWPSTKAWISAKISEARLAGTPQ